jgi:hypothetical protein
MAVRPTDPEALHLYQLIGAPLLAVIQAEAQAAQVSADFITRVGFEKAPAPSLPPPTAQGTQPAGQPAAPAAAPSGMALLQEGGDLGALRVAEFRIDRYAGDGTPLPYVARVPVLSLYPIPLMQVKHAEFDFDIRVLSRVPLEDPRPDHQDQQATPQASTDYLSKDRVELKGFLASSRGGAGGQATTDASIKIRVRMEQSDMPAGLIHLMKVMDESVTVAPLALLEEGRAKAKESEKPAKNP